jgi:mannose-6-phosphate isomerase-like protein (cupin superfamily)/DNA-binding XRE family transcriptional regulator
MTTEHDDGHELGSAIRERRRARSLTLVELAEQAGLSQPFLSQVENGRARPSLGSLHRIAEALHTTPQAFFGTGIDAVAGPVVVRAGDGRRAVSNTSTTARPGGIAANADAPVCHVRIGGAAPFHLLEFDGLPDEFAEYFTHDGFEATYVIAGHADIDLDGEVTRLGPGDSISYPARVPHRLRASGKRRARVLLIETSLSVQRDEGAARHADE